MIGVVLVAGSLLERCIRIEHFCKYALSFGILDLFLIFFSSDDA